MKAYAYNNFCCWACGIHRSLIVPRAILHAHEVYEIDYVTGLVKLIEIVGLCPNCHDYIHSGRMGALYDKGILDEEDCWVIRSHGDSICGGQPEQPESTVPWDKWYLELNGKKYYSKFKGRREWEEFYMGLAQ